MKFIKGYIEFISENNTNTLIIKKGTPLYHATSEKFPVSELGVGSYDKILWTAEQSGISATYIPVSGITTNTSTDAFIKPPKKNDQFTIKLQKQLGVEYDLNEIKYDNVGNPLSFRTPDIFLGINERYYELRDEYYAIIKKIESMKDDFIKGKLTDEQEDYYVELLEKSEKLQMEVFGQNTEKPKREFINDKLYKMGYSPISEDDYGKNHSWKLKINNGQIAAPDFRMEGRMFVLTPKKDLKIYDYSSGEGNLNDPDYHKLALFRNIEEQGYDGIKINDFAQVESEGNFGHKSIGLFQATIKYLDIKVIDGIHHPTEEEFHQMFKNGNWNIKMNEQYQVENKFNDNFKLWFKDSKIINKSGKPLILYHGTYGNFDTFKLGEKTRQTYYSDGFYFSNRLKKVYDYGDNILKCYLSIQKPFIMNTQTLELADKYAETNNANEFKGEVEQYCKYTIGYRRESNKFKENIIKDGYDGLIIEEYGIYIAFYPNQIKSINNDGSWDMDDNNIYS